MAEDESVIQRLHDLNDLGVGLSIDDFGTGYSTIEYIRQIPAKELKLDRQFVTDIHSSDRNRRLLQTTIELGHAVGLTVVVEGVEILEHVALIESMGADIIQGYYFSRPTDACDIPAHVKEFRYCEESKKNSL